MAENRNNAVNSMRRPKGFSPGARGPAGENAHEQGWQLNEEERTRIAKSMQGKTGGRDYNYGARDFGDRPTDASSADGQNSSSQQMQGRQSSTKANTNPRERARQ
jgi:hypothetical protein